MVLLGRQSSIHCLQEFEGSVNVFYTPILFFALWNGRLFVQERSKPDVVFVFERQNQDGVYTRRLVDPRDHRVRLMADIFRSASGNLGVSAEEIRPILQEAMTQLVEQRQPERLPERDGFPWTGALVLAAFVVMVCGVTACVYLSNGIARVDHDVAVVHSRNKKVEDVAVRITDALEITMRTLDAIDSRLSSIEGKTDALGNRVTAMETFVGMRNEQGQLLIDGPKSSGNSAKRGVFSEGIDLSWLLWWAVYAFLGMFVFFAVTVFCTAFDRWARDQHQRRLAD
jgi:hypothetical protein